MGNDLCGIYLEPAQKCDNIERGKSLVRALESEASIKSKLPTRAQFTLPLKSTSRLPPIGDNPEDVPDSVVDWFATNARKLVRVLDSAFSGK